MKPMYSLFLMFIFTACGEGEPKEEESCSVIDTDQCAERSDCVVLRGSEMLSNDECFTLGPEQAFGCISADEECDDYTTPANNGAAPAILFTSNCLPEGYDIVIFEQYPECEEE